MPAVNNTDLNNAKLDVDHIAAVATSGAATAIDRLGGVKKTMAGITAEMNAQVDLVEAARATAVDTTIPAKVAEVDEAVAATYVGQAEAAKSASEVARDAAELALQQSYAAQRIYTSGAAGDGDAGLAADAYYYVVSASGSASLELWQKNGAGGLDTGKRMAAEATTIIEYPTVAELAPQLNYGAGRLALVTADPEITNNGAWKKVGGVSLGGWEKTSLALPLTDPPRKFAATEAALQADLAHADAAFAFVYADPTVTNNGVWKKVGGVGLGGWERTGLQLPVADTLTKFAETEPLLQTDLLHAADTLAFVSADPLGWRSGFYKKSGDVGLGGWVPVYGLTDGYTASELAYYPNPAGAPGTIAVGTGLHSCAAGGGGTAEGNTAVGHLAAQYATNGWANTCVGWRAGMSMTDSGTTNTYSGGLGNVGNVFIGYNCGAAANGALDNTAVGTSSMLNLNTGMDNAALGINSLRSIEGGSENAAFGHGALQHIVGSGAIVDANRTGHRLTGVGDQAGRFHNDGTPKTGGRESVYVGAQSAGKVPVGAEIIQNEMVLGVFGKGRGTDTASYGNTSTNGHYFEAGALFAVEAPTATAEAGNLYRDPATGEIKVSSILEEVDDWTPAPIGSVNGLAIATSALTATFYRRGRLIDYFVSFTVAGGNTATGNPRFDLPVAALGLQAQMGMVVNTGELLGGYTTASDGGTAGPYTHASFTLYNSSGATIAAGRLFTLSGTYIAAP